MTSLSRFTIAVADVTLGDLMAAYGWVKIGSRSNPSPSAHNSN
jgi:hypothetical protein